MIKNWMEKLKRNKEYTFSGALLGGLVLAYCLFFLTGCMGTMKNCEVRLRPNSHIYNMRLEDVTIFREPGVPANMRRVSMHWSNNAASSPEQNVNPTPAEVNRWISELKRLGLIK